MYSHYIFTRLELDTESLTKFDSHFLSLFFVRTTETKLKPSQHKHMHNPFSFLPFLSHLVDTTPKPPKHSLVTSEALNLFLVYPYLNTNIQDNSTLLFLFLLCVKDQQTPTSSHPKA